MWRILGLVFYNDKEYFLETKKAFSEEKAKEGVQAGDYYAAIVIPENFSSSLVSILSGDLKRPKLDYYVNEKKNAIAPKITDTGATTVQQQINDTFSATASSAVSEIVSLPQTVLPEDWTIHSRN